MLSTRISSLETGRQSPVQTVKLNCGAAQWIGLLSASWRVGRIPSANTGNNRVTNRYKIVIPPRTDISFLGSAGLKKSRSIFPKENRLRQHKRKQTPEEHGSHHGFAVKIRALRTMPANLESKYDPFKRKILILVYPARSLLRPPKRPRHCLKGRSQPFSVGIRSLMTNLVPIPERGSR